MSRAVSRGLGIADVPIAVYPGVIPTDSEAVLERKVREHLAPAVIASLTARAVAANQNEAAEPVPHEIVHAGDLESVQEFFTARGWTDGLPIIPPTRERVQQALRFTSRDPDEVIGVLAPEFRESTVWNVAVNGVMAGCRPEYFPVLLAIADALADPRFRIQDAGSTPAWEPLVVISGPLVKELEFNFGTGVMRVGRQANSSIGRFVRMYFRNMAGLRIPPSDSDQGAIGYSFNVVLAEDDDAVTSIGWPSYREDKGFAREDSIITVRSVVTISAPIYSAGSTATEHLATISEIFGQAIGPWFYLGLVFGAWHPLLVMNPSIARTIAADDADKDAVRRYLSENVKTAATSLERYAPQVGHTDFTIEQYMQAGRLPSVSLESDGPEQLIRTIPDPANLDLVVAGSPSRNQSRAYVQNHNQGVPTSRKVVLPPNWNELLEEQRDLKKDRE